MSKTCNVCKTEQPLDAYSRNAARSDGYQVTCKACVSEYKKRYYLANGNKVKAKSAMRYAAQSKEINQAARLKYVADPVPFKARAKAWRMENPKLAGQKHHRRRARELANGVFRVTKQDLQKIYVAPCFYCGSKEDITVDHVIPIVRGGTHSIGNLVPACRSCNSSKNRKTITEWRITNDRHAA